MSKGKIDLTVDDIIATLKNSSMSNVIVEGSDDIVIMRRIEDLFSADFVSVLPAGGQSKVLQTFQRISELDLKKRCAFVADRDQWAYSSVPLDYCTPSIIFTDGYSIENDAIRDGGFVDLMSNQEKEKFYIELDMILRWFSTAMSRLINGDPAVVKTHPLVLLNDPLLNSSVDEILKVDEAARELLERLRNDPFKLLRGKTLLALIMRQLSYGGRPARHNHLALLDGVGANPRNFIADLFDKIADAIGCSKPLAGA